MIEWIDRFFSPLLVSLSEKKCKGGLEPPFLLTELMSRVVDRDELDGDREPQGNCDDACHINTPQIQRRFRRVGKWRWRQTAGLRVHR